MEFDDSQKCQGYEKHYSEKGFWKKLKDSARKMGRSTVYYALILFYILQSPTVGFRYKALIISALGYLILPTDLIPDFMPAGVGFADDAAALAAAYKAVKDNVTPDIEQKVNAKLDEWFGKAEE